MHELTNVNGRFSFKNIGRQRGESTQVFTNFVFVSSCSDRPLYSPSNLRVMHGLKRRPKFTITDAEVAYWRRIHDLNQAEKPAVPIEKPAQVFVVTTIKLITSENR
jgi:hypothetical protein